MMENCNYDRMEMMVYNMVRQGLFGECCTPKAATSTISASIKFGRQRGRAVAPRLGDEAERQPVSDARPRSGRQLPRHQSRRSLRLPRVDERPVARTAGLGGEPRAGGLAEASRRQYVAGDVNVSLIKTARGKTIVVEHCANLPRPYSRIHMVQGTKGLFQGYPNRVYIEGRGTRGSSGRMRRPALARVRASALEGDRRAAAGRRPRRHGLHRGLSPDQVPARGTADRHERLRRRVAQRRRRAERAVGGESPRRSISRTSRADAGRRRPPLPIVHM